MSLEVDIHYIQIGDCSSSAIALGLSQDKRLMPKLINPTGNIEYHALPIIDCHGLPYQQRLLSILEQVYPKLGEDWLSAPVCILMPHYGDIEPSSHHALFASYCDFLPSLVKHPNCYLFPYGRSALLLAWRKIETLLNNDQFPDVWVLAIDSDPRLSTFLGEESQRLAEPSAGGVASDSVILARFRKNESGLKRHWFSYEVQTNSASGGSAVEALFRRYQQVCKQPVFQFYAPFNGTACLADEWVTAYHRLAPWVGTQTQVVMSGVLSGELGACTGLYNLLHLYARYQSGEFLYSTLQLEISEQLFRGAAMYTWHN
ncbi:hypothetical protein [Photobacterium lutimaris]|uniref:Uncharacterized protein n=1 Tax=Photobacterium lutimaris TaxID=388278 RepID=A0A2T3IZN5_9GAMM|nr:hypothetical protein [Photobacterium lutimaris]PSU34143.1 hypothetical protein C9I99_09110 [Photobacterium lutimaris]TDR75715.1 hypothetical protein DFP78_10472 [Photobacterium lutimaris]